MCVFNSNLLLMRVFNSNFGMIGTFWNYCSCVYSILVYWSHWAINCLCIMKSLGYLQFVRVFHSSVLESLGLLLMCVFISSILKSLGHCLCMLKSLGSVLLMRVFNSSAGHIYWSEFKVLVWISDFWPETCLKVDWISTKSHNMCYWTHKI